MGRSPRFQGSRVDRAGTFRAAREGITPGSPSRARRPAPVTGLRARNGKPEGDLSRYLSTGAHQTYTEPGYPRPRPDTAFPLRAGPILRIGLPGASLRSRPLFAEAVAEAAD